MNDEDYNHSLINYCIAEWKKTATRDKHSTIINIFGRLITVKKRTTFYSVTYSLSDNNMHITGKGFTSSKAKIEVLSLYLEQLMDSNIPIYLPINFIKPPNSYPYKNIYFGLDKLKEEQENKEEKKEDEEQLLSNQDILKDNNDNQNNNEIEKQENYPIIKENNKEKDKEIIEENDPKPLKCKMNCGFYVNANSNGFCSSCLKKQDNSPKEKPLKQVERSNIKISKDIVDITYFIAIMCFIIFIIISTLSPLTNPFLNMNINMSFMSFSNESDILIHVDNNFDNLSNSSLPFKEDNLSSSIFITKYHILELVNHDIINEDQVNIVWDILKHYSIPKQESIVPESSENWFFTLDNVFFIIGTLFFISACTFFLNIAFQLSFPPFILVNILAIIIIIIEIIAYCIPYFTNNTFVAGLICLIATSMIPIFCITLQRCLNIWSRPDNETLFTSILILGKHIIPTCICIICLTIINLYLYNIMFISLPGWFVIHHLLRIIEQRNSSDIKFKSTSLLNIFICFCEVFLKIYLPIEYHIYLDIFWWGHLANFMNNIFIIYYINTYKSNSKEYDIYLTNSVFFSGLFCISISLYLNYILIIILVCTALYLSFNASNSLKYSEYMFSGTILFSIMLLFGILRLFDNLYYYNVYGETWSIIRLFGFLSDLCFLLGLIKWMEYASKSTKFFISEGIIITILFGIGLVSGSTLPFCIIPQFVLSVCIQYYVLPKERDNISLTHTFFQPMKYSSILCLSLISLIRFSGYFNYHFSVLATIQLFSTCSLLFVVLCEYSLQHQIKKLTHFSILRDISIIICIISTILNISYGYKYSIILMCIYFVYQYTLNSCVPKSILSNNTKIYRTTIGLKLKNQDTECTINFSSLLTKSSMIFGLIGGWCWLLTFLIIFGNINLSFSIYFIIHMIIDIGSFSFWLSSILILSSKFQISYIYKDITLAKKSVEHCSLEFLFIIIGIQFICYFVGVTSKFSLLIACTSLGLLICTLAMAIKCSILKNIIFGIILLSIINSSSLIFSLFIGAGDIFFIIQWIVELSGLIGLGISSVILFGQIKDVNMTLIICIYYSCIGFILLCISITSQLLACFGYILLLSGMIIFIWCYFVLWLVRCWAKPTSRFSPFAHSKSRTPESAYNSRLCARIISVILSSILILFSKVLDSYLMFWIGYIGMILLHKNIDNIQINFIDSLISSILFIFIGGTIQSLFIVITGSLTLLYYVGYYLSFKYKSYYYFPLVLMSVGFCLFIVGFQYNYIINTFPWLFEAHILSKSSVETINSIITNIIQIYQNKFDNIIHITT